ncbi:MAG: RnfH family protein [Betaproteobacteria bacterium]|nr:RnfH family protein [Betaproteobacteria bacterium]
MEIHDPAIRIEVVYALPEHQIVRQLNLPPGTTVEQAVKLSEISRLFPEIDLSRNKLGIYGALVRQDRELRDGDRVEIYRPLVLDPKDNRRKRAKRQGNATIETDQNGAGDPENRPAR